ncbi:restriction endonuclease subunit S [Staphylococcus haemolyticus]|uniref:restriction endonuclease subunit S n=1 Tax=Staphylococcus haemolyticus TaxID=1283 RepID=UPI000B1A0A45|nr:restriction endonuclease subunit S [Staphylococcus haemolyticus]
MEYKKYLLSEICDYKTGRLNSNAAVDNGKYKFFTCAPNPLTIDSYSYDDNVILLAGNNANGIFHINRFNGKFDAYQRTYIIKPKADVIDIDYLYYYLKFKLNFLQSQSIGSATKYLTKPILDKLEVYCPEKKMKQKAISSILKFLDKKLELNKKIIANLEELSQTLFKRWFVDFEFPDENGNPYKSSGGEMIDSELGEIPKGWKVSKFNDYIENIIPGDWGKQNEEGNYTCPTRIIRGADLDSFSKGNKGKAPIRYILEKKFQK